MALPPPKRRKLSGYVQDAPWAAHKAAVEDRPQAVPDAVKPLEEEQLARSAEGRHRDQQILLPRQGSAMLSLTVSTPASPSMSDISTSSVATTPADLALSLSLAASLSLPLLDIPGVVTELPASVVSGLISGVSGLIAPSTTPSPSRVSSPDETTIAPTISIAPNDTTSASRASLANDTTVTSSTSSVTRSSGRNSTTSSSLSSSSTGFVTSSFSRNSTTTSSLSGTESLSSTESALAYIATLSQGDVTTFLRSAEAYTTTFGDSTFTVAAASTTSVSEVSSPGSLSGSSSSNGRQTLFSTISTDGGGGDTSQYTATSYDAPTSTEPASNSSSASNSAPPAGTIAGGVVGGAAGLAIVVLIAMLAVRWYRRQGTAQHQALPQGPGNSPDPNAASSSGPGMAERAGLAPLVAAVPALFRHHTRDAESGETAQRGFTRVSGRKLPSAYSEGLGIQPSADAPASRDGGLNINNTSFNRESSGFYGGDGTTGSPPSPFGSIRPRSNSHEHMTISPGPQRMPKIHSGGPYDMSPGPSSPQVTPTLTRSDAPFLLDPNRNSRFFEGL